MSDGLITCTLVSETTQASCPGLLEISIESGIDLSKLSMAGVEKQDHLQTRESTRPNYTSIYIMHAKYSISQTHTLTQLTSGSLQQTETSLENSVVVIF